MTSAVHRYRLTPLVAVLAMAATLLLVTAPAAHADVTGGCEGSADFNTDSEGAYTPANDTRDNPIVVPKDDGTIASWQGSVPAENTDFSGNVEIRLGPFWIEVADWGFPDHDGTNADDERDSTTGVMIGEGAYDGLIAVFDSIEESSTWTLHGYIIDGELTPDPEPFVSE